MPAKKQKKRIFVVDDDKDFTSVIQLALEGRGDYEVRTENNPFNALAVAKEFLPDTILLDVVMPGMNGRDIAEQIYKEPTLRKRKIIYLTGQISEDEIAYFGEEIKGKLFIPKGISAKELIKRIEQSI